MIGNGCFEIPDFENVRIYTKIKSIAGILPEISKAMKNVYDLEFQDQTLKIQFFKNIFDILGLKIVRIDTEIMSV